MRRFSLRFVLLLSALSPGAWAADPPKDPPKSENELRVLPSLAEVIALASERSPALKASEAGYKASSAAQVGAARLPFGNPTLTVFAEHGNMGATKDVMIDGQLELPVEVWGQRGKRKAEAEAFIGASRVNVEVSRAQALADALESYGQVVVSVERLDVLKDAVAAARQEAEVFQARLEAQDAILRDAAMATMEVARLEALIGEAGADRVAGLAVLFRLTGLTFEIGTGEARAVPPGLGRLEKEQQELPSAPMVREADAMAKYHQATGDRFRSEGSPPLSLLLRLGRGDLGETRLGAGLVFGFPFFQRNQGDAAIADAQAERAKTTAALYAQSLARTAEGLKSEYRALEIARDTLERMALPAALEAVEQAQQMEKAGKSDLLPILVSRRDFAALRLRRLDVLARQWRALSDLARITGEQP